MLGQTPRISVFSVSLKGGAIGISEAIERLSSRARPSRLEKALRLKVAEDRLASLVELVEKLSASHC